MKNIKYIITGKRVMVYCGKKTLSLSKSDKRFKRLMNLIGKGEEEKAIDFLFPAKKIEKFTNKDFHIKGGKLYVGKDKTPVHNLIAQKLMECRKKKLDYKPLIAFWKNLKKNPSPFSQKQLFEFLTIHKHPITSNGMFLAYKYITENEDGNFVDSYTKKFNNNVGQIVKMDRNTVDENPSATCSVGLHVASHEYAKNGGNHMLEVLVNPKDVVAVPNDCNQMKMRVCEYQVIGIGKSEFQGMFIASKTIKAKLKSGIKRNGGFSFVDMTAQQIVKIVKSVTGKQIKLSLKSKQAIVRKAEIMFIEHGYMNENQKVDIYNMDGKSIVKFIKVLTGKTIKAKNKATILEQAEFILGGESSNITTVVPSDPHPDNVQFALDDEDMEDYFGDIDNEEW